MTVWVTLAMAAPEIDDQLPGALDPAGRDRFGVAGERADEIQQDRADLGRDLACPQDQVGAVPGNRLGEQFGRVDDGGREQEPDRVLGGADAAAHQRQRIVHVLGDLELGVGHDQAEVLGALADVLDRLAAAAQELDQLRSEPPAEDLDRAGRSLGRGRQRADLVGKALQPLDRVAVAGAEALERLVDIDDGLAAALGARPEQLHLAPQLLEILGRLPAGKSALERGLPQVLQAAADCRRSSATAPGPSR